MVLTSAERDGLAAASTGDSASAGSKDPSLYEPIAIIGCGLRLPGGVDSDEAMWQFLLDRREGRCRVPESRYNVDAFYGPGKAGHVNTEFGHFLEDVDLASFDTSFWSATRKEVEEMDPQQRLALEVSYECLQSSGATKWKESNTGVYIGIFGEDWADMHAKETQQQGMYRIVGHGDFVVANRVSYELGVRGPSVVIRTACSSSLTALHEACMGIHRGDCDSAIVAGTNVILNPAMTIAMAEQGVLSPDGRCKTFDESADGYVRAEGAVAIHIKKLSDAIRDNDSIRAVVRSTCTNSDGRTAGLSQPNSSSHERLIRKSHQLAGIRDLSKTAMIECHGTGTQVGDPLEASAVGRVFGDHGIYIGSAKSNFGHSEGASGLTGVVKAMLALEHRLIPPNVNFVTPNPKVPFSEYKLTVPIETCAWPSGKAERIGVNSYGIGGANAHALLDSAREAGVTAAPSSTLPARPGHLLMFSAASSEALAEIIKTHHVYAECHPNRLSDLCYTLGIRREHLPHRAYIILPSDAKQHALHTSPHGRIGDVPQLVFVFTGQGAQWAGMGSSLLTTNDTFRNSIASMETALRQCDDPPAFSLQDELLKLHSNSRLHESEISQPCCTAIQIGLVDALREWQIQPRAVLGHSSGEIAAAYAAGILTQADAIKIAYYRGVATKNTTAFGGMAAIGLGRNQVSNLLKRGIVIACENSPSSITLSGDLDVLKQTVDNIRRKFPEAFVRELKVDRAYHSHHMENIASSYKSMISDVVPNLDGLPFVSSVTGTLLTGSSADASYWVRNLVSPVLFSSAVDEVLSKQPSAIFVEVGPHSALAGPLRQIFKARNAGKAEYVPTLVRDSEATMDLLKCAGTMYQHGVDMDFAKICPPGRVLTDLPKYPWQRTGHYWSESRISKDWRQRSYPKHDLLGDRVNDVSAFEPTWRNLLRLDDVAWIRDHNISGDIVFPAAGYVTMAGEAIRQLSGTSDYTVRDVIIRNARVMREGATVEVITHLKAGRLTDVLDSVWYEFTISSLDSDRWTKHAAGQVRPGSATVFGSPPVRPGPRAVTSKTWYAAMDRVGLKYGHRFLGLQKITTDVSARRATSAIADFSAPGESRYAIHPCTIDFAFQLFCTAASRGLPRVFTQLSVPSYLEEVYVKPASELIALQCEAGISPHGAISGDGFATTPHGGTVLSIKGFRSSLLAYAESVHGEDPHGGAELVWKPDLDFLDHTTLMRVVKDISVANLSMDRLALVCAVECSLRAQDLVLDGRYLAQYLDWIHSARKLAANSEHCTISDAHEIVRMSSEERCEIIEDIYRTTSPEYQPVATAIYRISSAISSILTSQIDALPILVEDDILTKIYDFGRILDCRRFFALAAHQRPDQRILEVGAGTGGTTNLVLSCLSPSRPYIGRNYASYTFTDVSAGFFGAAKERFQAYEAVEYRVLDISQDPIAQGFEAHSFDLIIASNVLHATPVLMDTLAHVRVLLKPTGRLFLQELSPKTKWVNFVMGSLPGWWLGENDGRVDEPYLPPQQWEQILTQAGFNVTASHHDKQFNATIIAQPALDSIQQPVNRVTLLVRDSSHPSILAVASHLHAQGHASDLRTLDQELPPGQDIVILLDVDKPFLHDLSLEDFSLFRSAMERAKDSRMLWVTGSAQIRCSDPRYGISLGLIRTLRKELSTDISTLELETFDSPAWEALYRVLSAIQRSEGDAFNKGGFEWALSEGSIQLSRYYWVRLRDELSALEPVNSHALRLQVGKRGILNTLHWEPFEPLELQDDLVRVKIHTVGLNFKDVLIAMGIINGSDAEGSNLGVESAGTVMETGPSAWRMRKGDRCIAFSGGSFATSLTAREDLCVKIPDNLSFQQAASMATVFCTVIHGLLEKAWLERGQTVLIHSACGGVGLAAIQICREVGAKIYCTVGSDEKVDLLVRTYGIPRSHIFHSRDISFQQDVLQATLGRGVDVVLNSLSGELLHASWQCVAEFGCMVEIGKRDLRGKGTLALDPFEMNRSYIGVDLSRICLDRPMVASRLLQKMMDMYQRAVIAPIEPLTCFEATHVEDAMRFMQNGSHIGKVVVTLPEDLIMLKTVPAKPSFRMRSHSSFIFVGGLGGLGKAVAVWMAEAGASEIVFLSRSATETAENFAFVEELAALGCNAILVPGSVVQMQAVESAIAAATMPIRGILQTSMVLRDAAFSTMSYEDWQSVVEPKVRGTWNLHHACSAHNLSLDFFLMFSSLNGLVGQGGQAHYGAANSFLDSFVQYRQKLGLPAAVLDIGAMGDVGGGANDQRILEHWRTQSTYVLHEQELLDAVQLVLGREDTAAEKTKDRKRQDDAGYTNKSQVPFGFRSTQPILAPGNRTVWRHDPRTAQYRNLDPNQSATATSGNADEQLQDFLSRARHDLHLLDSADAVHFLATEIGKALFGFLMREDEVVGVDVSFEDIGIDSLISIELRNWFKHRVGLHVSVLEILGAGTLKGLSMAVVKLLCKKFAGEEDAQM